jgi:signal transduction histidine kinase
LSGLFFRHIRSLRWILPILIGVMVAIYELGPARWVEQAVGAQSHFVIDILAYGTLGPLLAFFLLDFISRWMEERETSELQAQVLAKIQEHANQSRRLSDDALQTLFAASILLGNVKATLPKEQPEAAVYLAEMEQAIDKNIQGLRSHLLAMPKIPGGAAKPEKAAPASFAATPGDLQLTK